MRAALTLLVAPVVAYGALSLWVYVTQRGQIYIPTPVSATPGAQALWLESQGERIKVWVVARPGPRALLYFGGNATMTAPSRGKFSSPLTSYFMRGRKSKRAKAIKARR